MLKKIAGFVLMISFLEAHLLVREPSAEVYAEPKEHAFIEDIIPYATEVFFTQKQGEWVYVIYPGNEGWMRQSLLHDVQDDPAHFTDAIVDFRGGYLFSEADTEKGPILTLPFETPLRIKEELPESNRRWLLVDLPGGERGYIQRSQISCTRKILSLEEMLAFSKNFLDTKYLWGGATSFGYDCSGFVQMLYRQIGVILPRNAYQQAVDPRFCDVETPRAGDLLFFRNSRGRVVHVGMMINDKEYIHSGTKEQSWISINSLANELREGGIYGGYAGICLRRLVR